MTLTRSLRMALLLVAAVGLFTGCGRDLPDIESLPDVLLEQTIEVDGIEIAYFDFNPAAPGTPILFIHGYSGTGYEAHFIHDDLGDDVRIISLDLPGLGRSGKPEIDYNLSFYLNFLRSFVQEMELEAFHLAGHSMGGKFSAVFAALEGAEMVESLILLAPYGLDGEGGDIVEFLSNTGSLVDVSFNLHNQTLIDVAVRLNVFYDEQKIPEDLVNYIAAATFGSEDGVRALANVTRNAIARDPIDWLLPEIAVPTLIIWGEQDRVLNFRHAETFHRLIPDSRLVAVNQCGHMPHVEQQEFTAAAILDFLAEIAPAGEVDGAE